MKGQPGDVGRSTAARVKVGLVAAYRAALASLDNDPVVLLMWAAPIAILLTAVVRGVHTWALGAEEPLLNWAGVIPGLLLAAALIAMLVWVYWQVRLDDTAHEPYVVAMATSVAVIGVCTEAFSGLTAVLWQEGHVASTRDAAPSLWAVEQYYLWHLADAVPLVQLPQTLRWPEPQSFDDQWSGVLLLLFKIMVIVPLVRVAFSGYALAQDGVVRLYTRRATKRAEARSAALSTERTSSIRGPSDPRRVIGNITTESINLWLVVVSLPVMTLAAYLVLRLVIAPSSPAHTWLTAQFPEGVHVADYAIDLPWLLKALDCVTAGLVILIFLQMMGALAGVLIEAMERGTGPSRAAALTGTVLTLGPAIVVGAMVSIALLHVGLAETTPSIPGDGEVNATISWFGWHLADVVPVLDLPDTLNWRLRFEFVDRWTGVILVAGKLLLVGLLAGPIAMLVRMSLERARARRPKPALLGAARRFRDLLDKITSLVDAAEKESLSGEMTHRKFYRAKFEASRATRLVGPAIEQLHSLFGPGKVVEAAEAAASSLTDRLDQLDEVPSQLFMSGREERARVLEGVRDRRRAATKKVASYDEAVSGALNDAK
jgi:hypothetical protein